jgi:hypothetical protein
LVIIPGDELVESCGSIGERFKRIGKMGKYILKIFIR